MVQGSPGSGASLQQLGPGFPSRRDARVRLARRRPHVDSAQTRRRLELLRQPDGGGEEQAFKNKVCKTEDQDKAPARGACRAKEARPRQEELAGTTEPKHQDPGKRSLPGRPFQAQGYFTTRDPSERGLPGRLEDHITRGTPRRYTRPGGARGATSFRARQAPWPGKIKTPARH